MDTLPEELIVEICKRLPASNRVMFSLVSRYIHGVAFRDSRTLDLQVRNRMGIQDAVGVLEAAAQLNGPGYLLHLRVNETPPQNELSDANRNGVLEFKTNLLNNTDSALRACLNDRIRPSMTEEPNFDSDEYRDPGCSLSMHDRWQMALHTFNRLQTLDLWTIKSCASQTHRLVYTPSTLHLLAYLPELRTLAFWYSVPAKRQEDMDVEDYEENAVIAMTAFPLLPNLRRLAIGVQDGKAVRGQFIAPASLSGSLNLTNLKINCTSEVHVDVSLRVVLSRLQSLEIGQLNGTAVVVPHLTQLSLDLLLDHLQYESDPSVPFIQMGQLRKLAFGSRYKPQHVLNVIPQGLIVLHAPSLNSGNIATLVIFNNLAEICVLEFSLPTQQGQACAILQPFVNLPGLERLKLGDVKPRTGKDISEVVLLEDGYRMRLLRALSVTCPSNSIGDIRLTQLPALQALEMELGGLKHELQSPSLTDLRLRCHLELTNMLAYPNMLLGSCESLQELRLGLRFTPHEMTHLAYALQKVPRLTDLVLWRMGIPDLDAEDWQGREGFVEGVFAMLDGHPKLRSLEICASNFDPFHLTKATLPRVDNLAIHGGVMSVSPSCLPWQESSVCLSGLIRPDSEEGLATEQVFNMCLVNRLFHCCALPSPDPSVRAVRFSKYEFLEQTWRPVTRVLQDVLKSRRGNW